MLDNSPIKLVLLLFPTASKLETVLISFKHQDNLCSNLFVTMAVDTVPFDWIDWMKKNIACCMPNLILIVQLNVLMQQFCLAGSLFTFKSWRQVSWQQRRDWCGFTTLYFFLIYTSNSLLEKLFQCVCFSRQSRMCVCVVYKSCACWQSVSQTEKCPVWCCCSLVLILPRYNWQADYSF